jgi:predicted flap endonuclease-1-like 5' DNA nuclease
MTYDLSEMPSIDHRDLQRLKSQGYLTTDDVLHAVRDQFRRGDLEQRTGLSLAVLVRWARISDLTRVMGLTPVHAELLDGVGIWSLEELRRERPRSLARRLNRRNARLGLSPDGVRELQVENWIEQAQRLRASVVC